MHDPNRRKPKLSDPIKLFKDAEQFVRQKGFEKEIEWCDERPPFTAVTGNIFLSEYAWVILNSGMRNKIISTKWQQISEALFFFNLQQIRIANQKTMMESVLRIFGNRKKTEAILTVSRKIILEGWLTIKEQIEKDPLNTLSSLPFIGPITKYHLARNLGFDYIKPDRHLTRLASQYNMTPFELCDLIHEKTGRKLGTIDVILWRFCEQEGIA